MIFFFLKANLFAKYCLVQFIEDNCRLIVEDNKIERGDEGIIKAMYLDNKFYPCLILQESGMYKKINVNQILCIMIDLKKWCGLRRF
mgnify:CR=1 FL=1